MYKNCFLVAAVTFFFSSSCFGQQAIPAPTLQKINEQSVTESIKFLASDELAGRDTPSPVWTKLRTMLHGDLKTLA